MNISYFSFFHVQHHVHADSPPPKTLISYGARDWVQTSTSPDEISFWVQVTSRLIWWTMPCNVGHTETDLLCCVTVSPVLLAGCIYVCQFAVVWSKMAHSSSKEGVVKWKARAKQVIHWWRKCFLGEHHKVQGDIFMGKVSAKLDGNPHVSPGYSTHLGQQAAAESSVETKLITNNNHTGF